MESSQQNFQHLYWRAGFGPGLDSMKSGKIDDEIKKVFENSKNHIPIILTGWNPVTPKEARSFTDAEKSAYRKTEREGRMEITAQIFNRQANASFFLREKLTLFWMGHFACRVGNPIWMLKYYNTISQNALGTFSELLKNMIRNAALLGYLNNNINRKGRTNENFARELMELFTLGIGNYSEKDVKEAARSLTGWGFKPDGDFVIRQEYHDTGDKTFHGQTGNFDGDDIIRIILAKKECSTFIVTKIYRYFVNHQPNSDHINKLSDQFFKSGYNIELLLKNIFTSEWFYDAENIGCRIKTPIELITGMVKVFNITFVNPIARMPIQKVLGQTLFDPPNVAGWPEGLSWIDSSTLMYRIRLPEVLLQDAESLVVPKEDFDAQETMRMAGETAVKGKKVKTTYHTSALTQKFFQTSDEEITKSISSCLLLTKAGENRYKLIDSYTAGTDKNTRIIKTAIYLMSLPEYQLC